MTTTIRTRFAPSPTGYLHLGGARTALFSWAFAKHHKGVFVLRIEDTDVERSTPEAVDAILEGMNWLGMHADEGPFYQMQRTERHREAINQLLEKGKAYYCYSSTEEVEEMREVARAKGQKPRYDGTWRPEIGKTLPPVPADRQPVIRFKTPLDGATSWDDMVKGRISIANEELDDLVIARADGIPTYNFCVVVDDWDMEITHVIRGDDHVNNTPRQIVIFEALGADVPVYGHVPMILGPDGEKLSKRHGAVSIMDYDEQGYLPEAMVNYLARLGWSHGDAELFSVEQFIEWFDTRNLSKSASQWDPKKLNWVNAHYIKQRANEDLAELVTPRIEKLGGSPNLVDLTTVMELLKGRAETLNDLAAGAMLFCTPFNPASADLQAEVLTDEAKALLADFTQRAANIADTNWNTESVAAVIKETLTANEVKMSKLGIPLRVAVTGQKQTPAVDAVLALIGKKAVLQRLQAL